MCAVGREHGECILFPLYSSGTVGNLTGHHTILFTMSYQFHHARRQKKITFETSFFCPGIFLFNKMTYIYWKKNMCFKICLSCQFCIKKSTSNCHSGISFVDNRNNTGAALLIYTQFSSFVSTSKIGRLLANLLYHRRQEWLKWIKCYAG